MKSLPITSSHYSYLLQSYKEYLQVLGYAGPTVKSWPVHARELLHYLEQQHIQQITGVQGKHIDNFIDHLKRRSNKRKKGTALSSSSINSIISAVNAFARFLNSTGKYLLDITPERETNNTPERDILTIKEIKQLYEATFLPGRENTIAMGQRDRAIIAIFYGCGLRRNEGRQLDTTDIDLQQRVLLVRKGKGNKQRYVPIAAKHAADIKAYIEEGRDWFLYGHNTIETWHSNRHGRPLPLKNSIATNKNQNTPSGDGGAFFISQSGTRMQTFYPRLAVMQQRAQISNPVTPHKLRHSIATHLLYSGMDIEEIAKFLGHASLASTQIYTHIINQPAYDSSI